MYLEPDLDQNFGKIVIIILLLFSETLSFSDDDVSYRITSYTWKGHKRSLTVAFILRDTRPLAIITIMETPAVPLKGVS